MPPSPKPDRERRRKNAPTFDWTVLPAEGRKGRAPALPPLPANWASWSTATKEWWRTLWHTPQATQWDPTGISLHQAAVLREEHHRNPTKTSAATELRYILGQHGLDAKSMMTLRWKIADDPAASTRQAGVSGQVRAIGGDVMPKLNGSLAEWQAYAVSCGASRDAIRGWTRRRLIDAFGSSSGGEARTAATGSVLDRFTRPKE